jgi:hypothetical protein
MNEATLFSYWLYQEKQPTMSRREVRGVEPEDMKDMSVKDLISVLYYGRDSQAMLALKQLRLHFEDELNRLNEIAYQGARE